LTNDFENNFKEAEKISRMEKFIAPFL